MSEYEGIEFVVKATGATPFDAVRMAQRVAKNATADLPTNCENVYTDAAFERSYPGFRCTIRGFAREAE